MTSSTISTTPSTSINQSEEVPVFKYKTKPINFKRKNKSKRSIITEVDEEVKEKDEGLEFTKVESKNKKEVKGLEKLESKFKQLCDELMMDSVIKDTIDIIDSKIQLMVSKTELINEFEIISYGIGSFHDSNRSLYQLSLIHLIRLHLITQYPILNITSYYYDPIPLSLIETDLLNLLNIKIIEINENGKRKSNINSLFFMPHCPLSLYENVLQSNFDKEVKGKWLMLGNRLDDYAVNNSEHKLKAKAPYVNKAIQEDLLVILPLNAYQNFPTAFNDLAITYFKPI